MRDRTKDQDDGEKNRTEPAAAAIETFSTGTPSGVQEETQRNFFDKSTLWCTEGGEAEGHEQTCGRTDSNNTYERLHVNKRVRPKQQSVQTKSPPQ